MAKDIDQDLLKRYLENSCSGEERLQVENWLEPTELLTEDVELDTLENSLKDRIWLNIEQKVGRRQLAMRRMKQWSRYTAAAAVLLAMTITRGDCLFFATDYPSNALRIEQIAHLEELSPQACNSDLYRISNLTNGPIELTAKHNSRTYTLDKQQTYLAVRLDDPGVIGDPVLVLTPEQVAMMPDVPLANTLATYIDNPKTPTTKYL